MDALQWKTLLRLMIWGYHYFRKPPYGTGRQNYDAKHWYATNCSILLDNGRLESTATAKPYRRETFLVALGQGHSSKNVSTIYGKNLVNLEAKQDIEHFLSGQTIVNVHYINSKQV